MQANFHSTFRQVEDTANFFDAQVLHITQHEDRTVEVGEAGDSGFDHVAQFGISSLLLRCALPVGKKVHGVSLEVFVVARTVEAPGAFQASESFVHSDTGEPCAELCPPGELVEVFVGAHVGILHDILAFRIIAQDAADHAIKPLIVAPNDDLEEGGVAGEHAGNDRLVRKAGEIGD